MTDEIIKYIVLPSNLFTLLLLSLIFLLALRWRKAALIVTITALGLYFILASGPVSQYLMSSLEYRYPAFPEQPPAIDIDSIVILTGDAEIQQQVPLSSYLNASSAFRVLEALRLYQMYPQARIIISGNNEVPDILQQMLQAAGISHSAIRLDRHAHNTYQSAVNLLSMVYKQHFILVTSAGHMPRAMAVFQAQGLEPVAAPTQFISRQNIFAAQYSPSPRHLMTTDLAIHEYLAMAWYRLTGKI